MIAQGRWTDWARCLDELLTSAELKDPSQRARLLQHFAETLNRLGAYAQARDCLRQATALFRTNGTSRELSRCLIDHANALFNLQHWNEMEQVRQEALTLGQALCSAGLDDAGIIADAMILQGRMHLEQMQYAKAAHAFTHAQEIACAADDMPRVLSSANFLGTALLRDDNPEAALHHFLFAYEKAQARDDLPGQGVVTCNLGRTYLRLGHPKRALAYLGTALRITRQTDNWRVEIVILKELARAYATIGKTELARQCKEEAQTRRNNGTAQLQTKELINSVSLSSEK
jgi:tetratricopeptide (TPR) repeat protein